MSSRNRSTSTQPVYQQPQPVYQQPQPVYQQPQVQEVYQPPVDVQIGSAPPPPQVEGHPGRSSPNHIWIAGYRAGAAAATSGYPGRYEVRRVPDFGKRRRLGARNGRYWRYAPAVGAPTEDAALQFRERCR